MVKQPSAQLNMENLKYNASSGRLSSKPSKKVTPNCIFYNIPPSQQMFFTLGRKSRKYVKVSDNDNEGRNRGRETRANRLRSSNLKSTHRTYSNEDSLTIDSPTKSNHKKFFFGSEFIKEENAHIHSPYSVICKTECHFLTLSQRQFQ